MRDILCDYHGEPANEGCIGLLCRYCYVLSQLSILSKLLVQLKYLKLSVSNCIALR